MVKRVYDLSMPLDPASGNVVPPKIEYSDHAEGANRQGARVGLTAADMPDGLGSAVEVVTTRTHAGTHMDAPYHYYPTSGGQPSRRIDQIPLDWCVGPGVVLDFAARPSGYAITPADLQAELQRIGHALQPGHVVLIRTGADQRFWDSSYPEHQPGMSAQATRWLVDQGVRVMGIDAWSWDIPLGDQAEAYRASGNKELIWEGHRVGKEAEFCIVEQLGNLHALPRPTGFTACLFPIKVKAASGAWVRAVAIFEE